MQRPSHTRCRTTFARKLILKSSRLLLQSKLNILSVHYCSLPLIRRCTRDNLIRLKMWLPVVVSTGIFWLSLSSMVTSSLESCSLTTCPAASHLPCLPSPTRLRTQDYRQASNLSGAQDSTAATAQVEGLNMQSKQPHLQSRSTDLCSQILVDLAVSKHS